MEIYKIERQGCEVNVLFTGKQYIFQNSYYGILAVATRKGYEDEDMNTFTLEYGNDNTIGDSFGGDYCATMAKRVINKIESLYSEREIHYDIVQGDVNKKYFIDIQTRER